VIFATAADPRGTFRSIAGLAIGFTISLDIFMGGPFTGAAMNPARAFGPELVENDWSNAWVWYVGPCWAASSRRSPTSGSTCGASGPSRSALQRRGSKSPLRAARQPNKPP